MRFDMEGLVVKSGERVMVSSQDVAEAFGKVHAKLIVDVEKLHCSDEFKVANFRTCSFTNKMNRTYKGYMMTKDGFSFLCMGFTGKKAAGWKERYINAFNAMEAELASGISVMDKFNQAVKLMEKDAAIASSCGKGLSNWRKVKSDHVESVQKLRDEVQLTLEFGGAK